MASRWGDIQDGMRAREQEERIKRNEKLLRGGVHGSKRIHLKAGILDARHRQGR